MMGGAWLRPEGQGISVIYAPALPFSISNSCVRFHCIYIYYDTAAGSGGYGHVVPGYISDALSDATQWFAQ